MGVLTGLAAFKNDLEGSGGGKIKYLKLKAGQTVKMWFLDDFDKGTPATEAGAGVVVMIKEHQAGKNYRIKAQCTKESEGRCYGCEQALAQPKQGWGVKKRVYANVLIDDGTQEPYVAVWNIATQKNAAWELFLEEYLDNGTVAATPWRVKRAGEGTDTTYIVKQLAGPPADFSEHERFDLSEITVLVPYDQQAEHYSKVWGEEAEAAPVADATDEW